MQKCIQIEKILSTAFYAANYIGLNEHLLRKRMQIMQVWTNLKEEELVFGRRVLFIMNLRSLWTGLESQAHHLRFFHLL